MVSSSHEHGEIAYVKIKSQAGADCSIRNPWGIEPIDLYAGSKKIESAAGEIISFKTKLNENYILVKKGVAIKN
jgi:hypothetical protein